MTSSRCDYFTYGSLASSTAPVVLSALAAIVAVGCVWDWPGIRRSGMPPGPRTYPIFGNMFTLKRYDMYKQLLRIYLIQSTLVARLRTLHAQYGDIISLKFGGMTLISIAGDGTHIRELLDKRGAIYSNRPYQIIASVASGGDHFLFQQDTEKWRTGRKQIVQHFAPNVMMKHERYSIQEAESVQLLYECLHEPERLMEHPMRYTASVVTCLTYGIRCDKFEDPAVHGVEHLLRFHGAIYVPGGRPPIVAFPWLNNLPEFMFPWRAKAHRLGQMMEKLYGGLAEIGRKRGTEGCNTECLAYKLMVGEKGTGLTWRQQTHVCGIVLEGGSDIVAGTILTCILGLIHDPESQTRARAEIDSICDQETLPSWRDEQSLPFIRAVIKETMRWRPPLPLAVPHRLEQDDYYMGYFLPKDSIVLCNSWTINMNPDRFEDPEKFKPERYLGHHLSMAESITQSDPLKRDHYAFGAGRRVCPGIQTAEQSIFIALSRLLWAFEFSGPPGVDVLVDQDAAFLGQGIRRPVPFPAVVKLRSEERAKTIEREMASAKEVYARYGRYKDDLPSL